jgi:hypothetical protein
LLFVACSLSGLRKIGVKANRHNDIQRMETTNPPGERHPAGNGAKEWARGT